MILSVLYTWHGETYMAWLQKLWSSIQWDINPFKLLKGLVNNISVDNIDIEWDKYHFSPFHVTFTGHHDAFCEISCGVIATKFAERLNISCKK